MGTSTRPVLAILPTSENIFVPLLPSVPIEAKEAAPLLMIKRHVGPRLDVVDVGRLVPESSSTAGYGGLGRGSPAFPSNDMIRAVSSPHTNAPAP